MHKTLVATALCAGILVGYQSSLAQATKRLKEKSETAAQQKSWEQVDKINHEADGTRARREQALKQGDQKRYTGGNITKSSVFPKSRKPKDESKTQDLRAKKKQQPTKKK